MGHRAKLGALIDVDNAQAVALRAALDHIAKRGAVIRRRIYGDFSNPYLRLWLACIQSHPLQSVQGFPGAPGKNVSDTMLVIDAMDLLHSRAGWAVHRVKRQRLHAARVEGRREQRSGALVHRGRMTKLAGGRAAL